MKFAYGRWWKPAPAGKKKELSHIQSMKKRPRTSLTPLQKKKLIGIGVCLAIVAFLWVIFAPHMGVYSLFRQRSKLSQLQVENVEIKEKNVFLQKEIERIQNDPEYFEKVARDKYGLLKDNEMVFEFTSGRKENKK
jgi:cell division protein FtsB